MAAASLSHQPLPDWSASWFQPWQTPAQAATDEWLAGEGLAASLQRHRVWTSPGPMPVDAPRRPMPAAPAPVPFEQVVSQSGTLPVRPCWHDAFNACVWHRLPRFKNALNEVHARELGARGLHAANPGRRTPVRDFATLLDENGVLLSAPPPLWEALARRDWVMLFWTLRPLWAQAEVLVIGHALLDQLRTPRPDLTAHVWALRFPQRTGPAGFHDWDAYAAQALEFHVCERPLAEKPLLPLPLMGIPGWCSANSRRDFYDNDRVFRPPRRPHAAKGSAHAVA